MFGAIITVGVLTKLSLEVHMRNNLFRMIFSAVIAISVSGAALADTTRVWISGTGFLKFGAPFIPRGTNYVRVGADQVMNKTFTSGYYSHVNASNALAGMANSGYNVVRVLVDEHDIGASAPNTLRTDYLSNVADFLQLAKAYNIEVVLTLPYFPWNYDPNSPNAPNFGPNNMNEFYLDTYFWAAKARYVSDVIQGLRSLNAPLDIILSYSIENEVYFEGGNFSGTDSGQRLMDLAGKQQLMDSNMVQWINNVTGAVKSVHSQALVTAGFFSQAAANANNLNWLTRAYWAIVGSNLDYVSIHIYPQSNQSAWDTELNSFFEGAISAKPIVLEEFGVVKQNSDVVTAAYILRDFQKFTCASSKVQGWLTWTWDTSEPTGGNYFWTTVEQNGAINGVLAPIARPNPCGP